MSRASGGHGTAGGGQGRSAPPTRGHGAFPGELPVTSETLETAAGDPAVPANAHVQALVRTELRREGQPVIVGRGVLEPLMIGPHRPAGLAGLFDLA